VQRQLHGGDSAPRPAPAVGVASERLALALSA